MDFWTRRGKGDPKMRKSPLPEPRHGGEPPSPWVERFAPRIKPGGTVLDVACGTGRHTRLMLALGHQVVAVDKYVAGIANLLGAGNLDFIEADLETGKPWPLGDRVFDAVIVTNYLYRPLFEVLSNAVAKDGVLIYETFAMGNERFGRPSNPDFLLKPGELLTAFSDGFRVVTYEHGATTDPRRAVVQRLCAIKDAH